MELDIIFAEVSYQSQLCHFLFHSDPYGPLNDYVICVLRSQNLTSILRPKITIMIMIGGHHILNNSSVLYAKCNTLKEEFLLKPLKIIYAEIFM